MPVLGITGSIATGKSTFAQRLKRRLNAELFDADAVARELLESNPAVKEEILSVFGPDVAGPDGTIDRSKLRAIVFEPGEGVAPATPVARVARVAPITSAAATPGTPATAAASGPAGTTPSATGSPSHLATPREKLEAILHPRIRARWRELAATYRSPSGDPGKLFGGSTAATPHRWLIVDIPLLFETRAEAAFDAIVVVACSGATQQRRLRERGLSPALADAIINSQLDLHDKMKRASHVIWSESSLTLLDEQAAVLAAHLQQRYG